LDRPEGLAVGHHYATDGPLPRPTPLVIYVADTGNNRIQRFSPDGQPLGSWGGTGRAPGEFMTPRGVAMDDKSELYVADAGNDRVQVLAPDGQPLLAKLRLKPTRGCLMLGSGTIDVVHPSLSGGADDVV
jgi:sugar lactone lactonase YvrE